MSRSLRYRPWRPNQFEKFSDAVRDLGLLLHEEASRIGDASLHLMAERFYLWQYEETHRCLDHLVPDGGTVLDWGAGVGHAAFVMARLGRQVTAYSPPANEYNCYNPTLERIAAAGGFEAAIGTDPHAIPLPDGRFDAIVGCGVLEHVRESGSDEHTALVELRRLLKPHGKIVLMHLPSRHSYIEFANQRRGRGHVYTYGSSDVHRMAAAAGLRVNARWFYGFLPKLVVATAHRRSRVARALATAERYYPLDRFASSAFGPLSQNHFIVLERSG